MVDSFRSNFQQVTDPIVKLGKTKNKSKSKEEIQTFLHLLEDDDDDMNEDESEPTIGKKYKRKQYLIMRARAFPVYRPNQNQMQIAHFRQCDVYNIVSGE